MKFKLFVKRVISRIKSEIYIAYKPIFLQSSLHNLPDLPKISPLYVREMNLQDSNDIQAWISLVENAYIEDGLKYDQEKAKKYFNSHPFMNNIKTFFVMLDKLPIATVTTGILKSKPHIGSVSRLAVQKRYQGCGLGKYIILFGYDYLRSIGIGYGQSVISAKRHDSIMSHLSCGFIIQQNPKFIFYNHVRTNIFQKVNLRLKCYKAQKKYNAIVSNRLMSNYKDEKFIYECVINKHDKESPR